MSCSHNSLKRTLYLTYCCQNWRPCLIIDSEALELLEQITSKHIVIDFWSDYKSRFIAIVCSTPLWGWNCRISCCFWAWSTAPLIILNSFTLSISSSQLLTQLSSRRSCLLLVSLRWILSDTFVLIGSSSYATPSPVWTLVNPTLPKVSAPKLYWGYISSIILNLTFLTHGAEYEAIMYMHHYLSLIIILAVTLVDTDYSL